MKTKTARRFLLRNSHRLTVVCRTKDEGRSLRKRAKYALLSLLKSNNPASQKVLDTIMYRSWWRTL